MESKDLSGILDAESGLVFLAGLDRTKILRKSVLTLHASTGQLSDRDQIRIETSIRNNFPDTKVKFTLYAPQDLSAPETLESFAGLFRHDKILFDPTGAFSRVSGLLRVTSLVRAALGSSVCRVLWQNSQGALVIVLCEAGDEALASNKVQMILDAEPANTLHGAIRTLSVVSHTPNGRFVPIDKSSAPVRAITRDLSGLRIRLAGIAALVSLGAASSSFAATTPDQQSNPVYDPGISALTGLTTLGENALGRSNPHQAIGGLRLYFCAGTQFAALPRADIPQMPSVQTKESQPTTPPPTRVVYGL